MQTEMSDDQMERLIQMKLAALDREYKACQAATREFVPLSVSEKKTDPTPVSSAPVSLEDDFNPDFSQITQQDDFGEFESATKKSAQLRMDMSEEKAKLIKSIMADVKITIPPWALNIDDEIWHQRVNQVAPGFGSSILLSANERPKAHERPATKTKKKRETKHETVSLESTSQGLTSNPIYSVANLETN
jgi:hypothetical protein